MKTKDIMISSNKKDQLINEQRKKLQEIRLQTQSQNTKLLKIQQKQREVQSKYQNQKKNMQQTLTKLSQQAQMFMKKQLQTTQQFENQKEQIFLNDRKKESYLKQQAQLQKRNSQRRKQIIQHQKKAKQKKKQLQNIRNQIKRYQIYQEFLREVRNISDDFGSQNQIDQFSGMVILQRYRSMQKKKMELAQLHRKVGIDKQTRNKTIQTMRKLKEQKLLYYNSKIKEYKQQIDNLTEQTLHLESQLEGKLNQNSERQRQIGQIIFSIRGLYLGIVGEDKQKQSRSIIQMLKTIKEERNKLTEYLSLFMQKTQDKRKSEK